MIKNLFEIQFWKTVSNQKFPHLAILTRLVFLERRPLERWRGGGEVGKKALAIKNAKNLKATVLTNRKNSWLNSILGKAGLFPTRPHTFEVQFSNTI